MVFFLNEEKLKPTHFSCCSTSSTSETTRSQQRNHFIPSCHCFLVAMFKMLKQRFFGLVDGFMDLHGAYYNFVVVAMGIFVMFIPIWAGRDMSSYGSVGLDNVLKSIEFKISAASLLVSTFPMIFEFLMDGVFGFFEKKETSKNIKSFKMSRFALTITASLIGLQLSLLQTTPSFFGWFSVRGAVFYFCVWCLALIVAAVLSFSSCMSKPMIFTPVWTASLNGLLCIAAFIQFYFSGTDGVLGVIADPFLYLVMIATLVSFYRWIVKLWKQRNTWMADDYAAMLYLGICVISMLGKFMNGLASFLSPPVDGTSTTPYSAASMIYLYTFCVTMVAVVPGRIAKLHTIALKDHVIDTKRSYIRFISHEMRTPLNIVSLGLKLCMKQINPEDEEELERLHTLTEISSACEAALDILNELLIYDKMENGILVLGKQNVKVKDLIMNSVDMFAVQFREKNIDYQVTGFEQLGNSDDTMSVTTNGSFTNNNISSTSIKSQHLHSPVITNNDEVYVDKNKIQQVLRNIISNAIKVTPEKGYVVVSIRYLKDMMQKQTSDLDENAISAGNSNNNSNNNNNRSMKFSRTKRIVPQYIESNLKGLKIDSISAFSKNDSAADLTSSHSNYYGSTHAHLNVASNVNNGNNGNNANNANNANTNYNNPPSIALVGGGGGLSMYGNPTTSKGRLRIDVIDSGPGMTEEEQKKLFKEIVQFQPEILQNGGGSGLGMWISYNIVKLHQGEIKVHSNGIGKGTTFSILIPMKRVMTQTAMDDSNNNIFPIAEFQIHGDDKTTTASSNRKATGTTVATTAIGTNSLTSPISSSTSGKLALSLLIVDDSRLNRKMLCQMLALKGHRCEEANDGLEAVKKVQESLSSGSSMTMTATMSTSRVLYDAILMDFMMPNMDGPTATREIRKLGYTGLIIGVTGHTSAEDFAQFTDNGASHVMSKPIDMEDLQQIFFTNCAESNRTNRQESKSNKEMKSGQSSREIKSSKEIKSGKSNKSSYLAAEIGMGMQLEAFDDDTRR